MPDVQKELSSGAIEGEEKGVHAIDQSKCTKCGVCFDVCPSRVRAVAKISSKLSSRSDSTQLSIERCPSEEVVRGDEVEIEDR
jgi:Fe-S-cluster-containing hydrogenase component 2